MAEPNTEYKHIDWDDEKGPYIAGTRSRVIDLVMKWDPFGFSPEELYR